MEFKQYNELQVISTNELCDVVKVKPKTIMRGYLRHKERFVEGKHYIILTGDALKEYKKHNQNVSKFVSVLYLWTELGVMLLMKLNKSSRSWEILSEYMEE